MYNMHKKIAKLICYGDAVLDPKKWLAEEASNLALRIRHLDEIPSQAILPLAKLVADGESDVRKLSLALDIDNSKIEEYLEALCEYKFVNETGNGYEATLSGEQAFEAIGERMVIREMFQIKARLQQLEQLASR
jgi:hypothetical protein